jgi:superfamily II DNA or RNA helicase
VEIEMGSEGTYGKGIMLKRALNKQQFFTHHLVSKILTKMLHIPQQARVYDPTCGSGRMFEYMPNHGMCHGVELEENAYDIASALYPEAQIVNDDTMLHIHEKEFNYVIGNPPFTLTFEDKAFLFKYAGFNNTMFSEVAVMEIAIRSVKNMGYVALVMPENVFLNKFQDKDNFMKYFTKHMNPIAKIDLPKKTHAGTVYPASLYIFKNDDYFGTKYTANLPTFDFKYELNSFEDQDIDNLLAEWHETNSNYTAKTYAENYVEVQEPYKLEPAIIKEWKPKEYLRSVSKIATNDIATLDLSKEIDIEMGFDPIPITVNPNGLHALMKTVNIAARHPMRWNTAQKRYVDIFKENMLVLDAFMNPKVEYDNVPIVKEYFKYDTAIEHTDRFAKGLERRKWFMEFQNTPFLQWIDENNDGHWKPIFQDEDFKTKYPKVYNQWVDRYNQFANDPEYVTYLPFINAHDNWIAHLFEFQKEDAIRMAMKNSVMYCAQMGLGKTRTSIAAVLMKKRLNNLIICKANFKAEWVREFAELGLPDPFEIYYEDDIEHIDEHQFCLVTYETLKSKTRGKRPKGRRSNPPAISNNFDLKSPLDKENEIRNFAESYGVSDDMDLLDLIEMGTNPLKENPPRKKKAYKSEDELTKSEQKLAEMSKMFMFVDRMKGRFDVAIADECHVLANPTTFQSEAVRRLGVKEWVFLTGTPIKNRVHGLLSIIVMGWGENNHANPYTKAEFLEHFKFTMEFDSVYIDSHGHKKTSTNEREVPAINNPDDLRTLMAGKWLRRVHYEPDVTRQLTFPIPEIRIRRIKPEQAEINYARQWYDEFVRLQKEIDDKKKEISDLKAQLESGDLSEWEKDELEQKLKELRVLIALSPIIIGKLRFIALVPQIDPFENTPDDSALLKWIHITESYKGKGLTPQQQELFDEIVTRVKKGEQCYTVCWNKDFNYFFKDYLEAEGIKVKIVDGKLGTGDKKTQVINEFKDKKLDVLLTTITCFSVGINIPHASYCGMIQPEWNWADMTQAYSRMIRPQSKGTRTVDFFILEDSVVEYVHQLFDMKRVNLEYVLDYHPKPPDEAFLSWQDMVKKMFEDLQEGNFSVG